MSKDITLLTPHWIPTEENTAADFLSRYDMSLWEIMLDKETFSAILGHFSLQPTLDVLIVAINVSVDWNPYIASMRPNGVIVFVGAITDKPLPLQIFGPFIAKQVLGLFFLFLTIKVIRKWL